jgi:hypothetical protein
MIDETRNDRIPRDTTEPSQRDVLARLAARGIRTIEIRLQPGSCLVCSQTSEGGRHPISHAPALPVRGCRRGTCRCRYVGIPPAERIV